MKANPDKFHAIAIGSKTSNESISFNLDGNKINCEKKSSCWVQKCQTIGQ
jgi:hypothetical protein